MKPLFVAVLLAVAAAALALEATPNKEAVAQAATPKPGPILVTATLTKGITRRLGQPGKISDLTQQRFRVNDRQGRPIGRFLLLCRWVLIRTRLCSGELKMPLGQITVAGTSFTSLEGEFAVTGGTGAYNSAGGVLMFTSIGGGKLILSVQLT